MAKGVSSKDITAEIDERLADELETAVYSRNINKVNSLLKRADVNHPIFHEHSLLHIACEFGSLDMVKALVQTGANSGVVNSEGDTPLHHACRGGRLEVGQYLVEEVKCDVGVVNNKGATPLHRACQGGGLEVVQYLVEEVKCNFDVVDSEGTTPLHDACQYGRLEVVQYLVEEVKCNVGVRDHQGMSPLDKALEDQYDDGCVQTAHYLITQCGCVGGKEKGKLLCGACYCGKLDVVKELVEQHNIDPNGVVDSEGATPLHRACERGILEVVQYLVEEVKCDVGVVDSEGATPLHLACWGGRLEVVLYLVEEVKCDVGMVDSEGATPLHHACQNGRLEVVQYLVEEVKCNVDVRDDEGRSPLDRVLEYQYFFGDGWFQTARYLITKCGCGGGKEKGELLCGACYHGKLDVVKELVEQHNIDPNNVTNNKGKTPLELATEKSTSALEKLCSEIIDYLKSLPTKHRSHVMSSQNNTPGTFNTSLATPLSEEDTDALHKLLHDNKVRLPSGQLTLERVQHLLSERGHKELASNLRAEMDKVIKVQQEYAKRLRNLMTDKDMIELRYLKTFLVGPPGVGKTTTLNRLLKRFINIHSLGDSAKPQSTLLANCYHVFALVSGDGTEWISSSDLNHEAKLLIRYLCGYRLEEAKSRKIPLKHLTNPVPEPMLFSSSVHRPCREPQRQSKIAKSLSVSVGSGANIEPNTSRSYSTHNQHQRIHSFVHRFQELMKSDAHTVFQFLNILGSTLLNINDIGGQPGFLEMLPALSTGPAMYLVFFDMSKDLDKRYKIPFNRGDTVITPYDAMYTVKATISQILSAVTSVHCISPETSQLDISKAAEFGEKFRLFQQVKPVAALIGTHKDQLKNPCEEKLECIHKTLHELTDRYSEIVVHNSDQSFFAVDNLTGTDEVDVGLIRHLMSEIFQTHFKDSSLPIRPKWLLFSLILRREFAIVSKDTCLEIAESLEMDKEEIDFALWYLHFCTGTLMYYPDISGEWFKDHIICSPQVVFDSISELIVASLRTLHTGGTFTEYEKKEMIQRGQFSLESIEKYCSSYQVQKNLEKVDLIPPKQLVRLLEHVNLLAPITHSKANGSKRITYLLPTILDCASLDELATPSPSDANHPEPVFFTFECGYVPTGSFCGLVTRLVSQGPSRILGLRWELVEESIKRNCASFSIEKTSKVTLIARERCFEIRLTYKHSIIQSHDLCSNILSTILYFLKSLYKQLVPLISFKCPCPEHQSNKGVDHLCTLDDGLCVQFICGMKEIDLNKYQHIWLGMPVMIGGCAELEVLTFAEVDVFSFHWTKSASKRQIKTVEPNVLTFQTVCEKDLGYYRCEVREAGRMVFTVYRALYRDHPMTGENEDRKKSRDSSFEEPEVKRTNLSGKFLEKLKQKHLTDEEISELIRNGIHSLDDLKGLTHQDVEKMNLNIGGRLRVKQLISSLSPAMGPPQATLTSPSVQNTFSGVSGLTTVTIEELKTQTRLTDSHLDSKINEKDMQIISVHFDNVESYLTHLDLSPAQKTNIKDLAFRRGIQIAMSEALSLWTEHNPFKATYRNLVMLLLELGKGKVAYNVCVYLSKKTILQNTITVKVPINSSTQ